jgi:hypothetical protein
MPHLTGQPKFVLQRGHRNDSLLDGCGYETARHSRVPRPDGCVEDRAASGHRGDAPAERDVGCAEATRFVPMNPWDSRRWPVAALYDDVNRNWFEASQPIPLGCGPSGDRRETGCAEDGGPLQLSVSDLSRVKYERVTDLLPLAGKYPLADRVTAVSSARELRSAHDRVLGLGDVCQADGVVASG